MRVTVEKIGVVLGFLYEIYNVHLIHYWTKLTRLQFQNVHAHVPKDDYTCV